MTILDEALVSITYGQAQAPPGDYTTAVAWRGRFVSDNVAWAQRNYTTFVMNRGDSTTAGDSTVQPGAPGWAAVPAITNQTTATYSISATRNSTCVLYGVAVAKGDAAPATGQIINGQNAAGGTAKAAASSASGTGAVTLDLTPSGSPPWPVHDLYFVLANAIGASSVQSLLNEMLDAPTGYLFKQLATISGTGALAFTVAAPGDVWKTDEDTTEDAYNLTLYDTGDFMIEASGDLDRISFQQWLYDASAQTWLGPGTVYVNNNAPAPVGDALAFPGGLTLEQNSTITPFSIHDECADTESDTFTVSIMAGAWPTGLAMGGAPSYTLSGTPTQYGRSEITLRWVDSLGDYYDEQVFVNIGPKLPDVVGMTVAQAQAALAIASLTLAYVQAYHATFPAGDVISMSPVADTVVPYDQLVTLTISLGPAT